MVSGLEYRSNTYDTFILLLYIDAELAVLIKDFLQTLGLAQTAAVFDAEWVSKI